MSIDLNIKNYKQPAASSYCGPYCMKMVLKHFGIRRRMFDIMLLGHCSQHGMLDTGIVLGLKEIGLNPTLFIGPTGDHIPGEYATLSKEKLIEDLSQKNNAIKRKTALKKYYTELVEVVNKDLIKFETATYKNIVQNLQQGNPIIVSVKAYILYNWTANDRLHKGHFVIIQGYDDDSFIINDPSFELGGVYPVQKDKLLLAVHTWSNSVIIVKK